MKHLKQRRRSGTGAKATGDLSGEALFQVEAMGPTIALKQKRSSISWRLPDEGADSRQRYLQSRLHSVQSANGRQNSSHSSVQLTNSRRRSALTASHIIGSDLMPDLMALGNSERRMEWLRSLKELDPRQQILNFFNDLSVEGVVSDFFIMYILQIKLMLSC